MKRTSIVIWSLLMLMLPVSAQDYYKILKQTRISTGLNEAGAVPFEDGVVYITESTSVGASSPADDQGRRLFTIFYLGKNGQKKPFREELVTQNHEGPVSFTGDYNSMVFSQQRPASGARVDPLGLYFSDRNEAGDWVNERAFDFNSPEAWLFSPSLSRDGQTLYFSANYPDGMGGFDIYRSELRNGAWTKPENLGPAINSEGNELYPFIHPTGRLFFSTDGRDGNKGGFDLFETAFTGGRWLDAIKMSTPVNSLSDDYQIWFNDDFKQGLLTSNRQSRSKEIWEISTDIPEFETPEPIRKTYYTYLLRDKRLDSIDDKLFSYYWVINDTLELPGHEVQYRFPEPGVYECKLMVYDIQLDTTAVQNTLSLPIRLNEQAVIICPDTITTGTPVGFDGSETYLPGFDDYSYIWDFGDGSYGQGKQVLHTYLFPGQYRVTLGVQERKLDRKDVPEMRSNFKDVTVILPEH